MATARVLRVAVQRAGMQGVDRALGCRAMSGPLMQRVAAAGGVREPLRMATAFQTLRRGCVGAPWGRTESSPMSSEAPVIKEIAGVQFQVDARPAPGHPFHLAFPVHDLEAARHFYGAVLGCKEGRNSPGALSVFFCRCRTAPIPHA